MKKILIIGSEGFIGHHLVKNFINDSILLGCDLLDIKNSKYKYFKIDRFNPSFSTIIEEEKPDIIVNAGGSGNVPLSFSHPTADFQANTVDHYYLLEAIRKYQPACQYIYFSSAAVYGNPAVLPVREDSPLKPLSPYGWHKWYGELICQEYAELYQINTVTFRPFSVYGPGLKKQIFWDLFNKAKGETKIVLYGTGDETRDFIFIDDFVQAVNLILNTTQVGHSIFNLATGTATTIREAASIFVKLINPGAEILFNGLVREGDPRFWKADVTKLESMGFNKKVELAAGLSIYYDWVKDHFEN